MENMRSIYRDHVSMILSHPGMEFRPTEQELVYEFLIPKNSGEYLNDHINEVNLYGLNPFDLPQTDSFTYSGRRGTQIRWYYYVATASINDQDGKRISVGGYWKKKGCGISVEGNGGVVIGAKRSFVFYATDSVGGAIRTNWIMQEFSLFRNPEPPFVLCRLYRRSTVSPVEVMDLRQGDDTNFDE
ncbi:NAC domain-containing protein JA2-like [Impatiens glandulifera]|uniref:NAC domain-containing protein JA2-like n=1 Tax=Impatiens glandulifera TaxID=253017 RepID=UPI001FB04D0E|nr:NAC domain-containing protein JA2-like [Impatiens glandulifera]